MARILIIDDTQGNREFARIALESIGHEVLEASTGREGLAVALRTLPDLVLLDLRLPEWDGFTTLIEFRKEPLLTHIPVIALSASAMKGDDVRVLQAGFSGYISKPVPLYEFRNRIRSVLLSSGSST